MSNKQKGSCRCGKSEYEIDLTGARTLVCHCIDCQRHLGAPFSVFTVVHKSHFRWLQKPMGAVSFSNRAVRLFCSYCGTYLKWEGKNSESEAEVNVMTLENPFFLKIDEEIYTRSRLPWVKPIDGATQYESGR